jgi:hypothetical protein
VPNVTAMTEGKRMRDSPMQKTKATRLHGNLRGSVAFRINALNDLLTGLLQRLT